MATIGSFWLDLLDKVVLCAQGKALLEVMDWCQRSEQKACSFEEPSSSSCALWYLSLDCKLAHSLTAIATRELERSPTVKEDAFATLEQWCQGDRYLRSAGAFLHLLPLTSCIASKRFGRNGGGG